MRCVSAILKSGRPTVTNSPGSAYFSSTVPESGALTRHLRSRSRNWAACVSVVRCWRASVAVCTVSVERRAAMRFSSTLTSLRASSAVLAGTAPSATSSE